MSDTPLYNALFPASYEEDDFGYSSEWKDEIEKWLKATKGIDESIYNKQKNRVKKAKQRDELLGEYKAMYVAKTIWGVNDLGFTDEENASKKTVDFIFKDLEKNQWYAEVKSPSWEAELAEDCKRGKITLNQFKKRKKLPQYINGEGRWMGFNIYRNPIIDALKKFKDEENNLLVLCPNTFGDLGFFGEAEEWHKLKTLIAELDPSKKISAVCHLTVALYPGKGFSYTPLLVDLGKLPKVRTKD